MTSKILVGGCGSTGSTILAKILNAHPQIMCRKELSVWDRKLTYMDTGLLYLDRAVKNDYWVGWDNSQLYPIKYTDGTTYFGLHPNGQWKDYFPDNYRHEVLIENMMKEDTMIEAMIWFMNQGLRWKGEGATIWAEKTPGNIFCLTPWLAYFKDDGGKVILTTRNFKDTVSSLIYHRNFTLESSCLRYALSHNMVEYYRRNPHVRVIDYDELIYMPEKVLSNLWEWLGVDDVDLSSMIEDRGSTWEDHQDIMTSRIKDTINILSWRYK